MQIFLAEKYFYERKDNFICPLPFRRGATNSYSGLFFVVLGIVKELQYINRRYTMCTKELLVNYSLYYVLYQQLPTY